MSHRSSIQRPAHQQLPALHEPVTQNPRHRARFQVIPATAAREKAKGQEHHSSPPGCTAASVQTPERESDSRPRRKRVPAPPPASSGVQYQTTQGVRVTSAMPPQNIQKDGISRRGPETVPAAAGRPDSERSLDGRLQAPMPPEAPRQHATHSALSLAYSLNQRPVAPQGRARPVSVTGSPSSSQVHVPPYFSATSRCRRYPSTRGPGPWYRS